MDERRDPQPAPGRRPTVAAGIRLSPVQEAWSAYVEHSLHACPVCRRVDGSPCEAAEDLYRTYQEQAGDAYRRLES